MTETTNFLKEYNELKEQILKEGDTLVSKRDLLERFVKIDNEYAHRPWNLLQILANINILIGIKPCDDAISREQAFGCFTWTNTKDDVYYGIKALPPATPKSKIGHWIEHPHEAGENWEYSKYECSECHVWAKDDSNFCPDCGVKMLPPGSDCNSCEHRNEVDGSNCYECVKGIRNNYKADSEKEEKYVSVD